MFNNCEPHCPSRESQGSELSLCCPSYCQILHYQVTAIIKACQTDKNRKFPTIYRFINMSDVEKYIPSEPVVHFT